MEFNHISVLFKESIDALEIKDDGIYVDGTLGGGGHSEGILEANDTVKLIGIDQDSAAIEAAGNRLSVFGTRVTLVRDNFKNVNDILDNLGIDKIDGGVLDLGVSSHQLDTADRGFSYMHDAPLDMRMDTRRDLSAAKVVNEYEAEELTRIFYEYGEEKWSKRIAQFICDARKKQEIRTTGELVDIIKAAIPQAARLEGGHPAKRVFQAIRIEVNGELEILEKAVKDFAGRLKPGGRLAIITFHSLEDRIVKNAFTDLCTGCICPKEFPVCMCGHEPEAKKVTRKPVLPGKEELSYNKRSKSAKLRVIEKL